MTIIAYNDTSDKETEDTYNTNGNALKNKLDLLPPHPT